MPMSIFTLGVMLRCCAARCAATWHDEEGGVAEKVVIVAVFVALAIAAGAVITQKVMSAANNINMN